MSSYTVLLAEDSDFITQHVSQTLESEHGFEIETVTSASETRDTLAESDFDCVVSTYELPDETGIELAESINGDGDEVPFVLFTGNPLEPLAEEALEAGVSAFVSKSSGATGGMDVFANRIRLAIAAGE
ncbi:response regulator [Natrialba swarupiae]|uniref:Response regulator n=1 Tax=Natrialba swarupiae TaxID=2448032 RepID=A0A5D5ANW2_9EURY|nr:response regulator [Natrialba swarupiae]TYT63508.1 response regulator [Natrialba swarupiae]